MPLISKKSKSIAKRHILGWREPRTHAGTASKQDVINLDTNIKKDYIPRLIKQSVSMLKAGLYKLRRERRVQSTFISSMVDIPASTWTVLPFDYEVLQTANVNNYRYYSVKEGAYHSDVFLIIKFDRLIDVDTIKLAIYKNGSAYKLIDYKTAISTHPDGDSVITLQGSAITDLICGDYMDVRVYFTGTLDLFSTQMDYVYAYWDVHFAGCNFSKNQDVSTDWTDDTYI